MLSFLSFVLILLAYFIFYKINPVELSNNVVDITLKEKSLSIKKQVLMAKGKKKDSIIYKYIRDTKNILEKTNKTKQLPFVVLFAIGGACFSSMLSISMSNYYLAPVLFFIFLMAPFIYIKNISNIYKKELDEELETTMSVITSSYARNNNILTAVSENLEYMNGSVKKSFEKFLANTNINPNIKKALEDLKNDVTNPIFKEWVDNLILCQEDSSIKLVLNSIVKKMQTVRELNSEKQVVLSESKLYFTAFVVLGMLTPFGVNMLPENFVGNFFESNGGKISVAVLILTIFLTYTWSLKILEPMEE